MARQFYELSELVAEFNVPVICAGDLFDKYNPPPELINFAMKVLPDDTFHAVAGQHDLPLHNLKDIHKSAYWTLSNTPLLRDLGRAGTIFANSDLRLYGFPWGSKLLPLSEFEYEKDSDTLYVAVVHRYCWLPKHNPAKEIRGPANDIMMQLQGFDAIVVGDNHSGFIINTNKPKQSLINCGTFFRRRTDERNYRPMVGLLLASGKIVPYYMDVSQDKFIEAADEPMETLLHSGFAEFVTELERLESDGLDFADALVQSMKTTISPEGRKLILEALEGAKG